MQGEGVVDVLPLSQAGRTPEAQPRALRPAEGPDADVQFRGGPQGDRRARPPLTDNLSTKSLRPSTGSVTSKSISSRHGSWSSARTVWGTVETAAVSATADMTARKPLGFLRRFSLPLPLMPSLSASTRLGLPNQRWGRKGIRPPTFSRPLRLGRRPRRVRPARFAIRLNGPGAVFAGFTGCAGAGGSLRTSSDGGPA